MTIGKVSDAVTLPQPRGKSLSDSAQGRRRALEGRGGL
jgi:hypothetical protein